MGDWSSEGRYLLRATIRHIIKSLVNVESGCFWGKSDCPVKSPKKCADCAPAPFASDTALNAAVNERYRGIKVSPRPDQKEKVEFVIVKEPPVQPLPKTG